MDDPEFIVRGARLFFGLVVALILTLALMIWAAIGGPMPDWQMPCPKAEEAQIP